jgi:putative hydrolase of the HAD superfamily
LKYKTLFFDADETLFDFKRAGEKALEAFYRKKNITCTLEEFKEIYQKENHQLWKLFETGAVTAEEVKVARFVNTMKKLSLYEGDGEELSQLYISELAKCDYLLDGAEDLILKIKNEYKMLIITNGFWDVQKIRIGQSHIIGHFEELVVSEKVGFAKPDRRIFDFAFNAASNPEKEDVLIIGDSLSSDIKGGSLYGIDTCWFNREGDVNSGAIQPTYEVKSFNELEELLLN